MCARSTCSRFAIAKCAWRNDPLITMEMQISALYTASLSELPKQH